MIQSSLFVNGVVLSFFGISITIYIFLKRKSILKKAEKQASDIIHAAEINKNNLLEEGELCLSKSQSKASDMIKKAKENKQNLINDAELGVALCEERIDRLNTADKEITSRLKQSRAIIENITDKSCSLAADIELLTEDDLQSSKTYQEDRKEVKAKLKKLAINAIDGVSGSNSNVNIGKFISISAKSDMAGALLLTTVEMLCSKLNANNSHQAIEKLSESIIATEALIKCIDSRAIINEEFKNLLLKRLEIEIHFKKAKQLAKEDQRELREQEREERKARQEAERLQKDAEKEELIKSKAIADLEREMSEKSDAEKAVYKDELERLKKELDEAHQKFERAKSRAQETKQGHVYVISNIGSFGKSMLKIGMTRRMEPMDRVKELGDASVPFTFDVHALIESDDAPNLESTLHRIFDDRRVNKVNRRKEYFNVELDEIEQELQNLEINALFNKVASADEYYQSIKIEDNLATV
jgi:hypothetical protein